MLFTGCKDAVQTISQDKYIKVPYSELAEYLKNTASATAVNYIEVTGNVPVSDLIGMDSVTSAFGKKIKDNVTKRVALKLPHIAEKNIDMSWCFYNCSNLVGVENLPQTATKLQNCFEFCTNLIDIPAIPEKAKDLTNCFLHCLALTKVSIISESITTMTGCFHGCTKLQEVAIASESIQSMNGCFTNCENLQKILSLPNKAADWSECFSSCSNLKELPAIPESATNIRFCFADCFALTSVTLNCDFDHLTDNKKNAFYQCFSLNDGSIKVPEASYDSYTITDALSKMAIPGSTPEEQKAKFATIKQD